MSTTPTQIRIDSDVKQEASALFGHPGLDMSSTVNLFLHQCVLWPSFCSGAAGL